MPFYVKLGPRGLCFRFGTMMIGIFGGYSYWRASRKRLRMHPHLRIKPGKPHAPLALSRGLKGE